MLHANICCQDDIIHKSTRFKLSLFHSNQIDNNHLSTNSEYNDYFVLNFPLQFTFNQVGSTTDPLDKVVLTEIILRPTKKPKSVGPHKSILKKNGNKRKYTKKTRNSGVRINQDMGLMRIIMSTIV